MKQSLIACSLFLNALVAFAQIPCEGGLAGEYPCEGLDLLSAPLDSLGGANGNGAGVGWILRRTGNSCFGRSTDCPLWRSLTLSTPRFGSGTHTVQAWRDVKVFDNHAFVVSGMTMAFKSSI